MGSAARAAGVPQPAPRVTLRVPAWVASIFCAAVVLVYLGTLGHFALAEPDEARYAEIAREMIELRDWVTPHLNYVKYFEKPPLIYWLTAINFELFGMSELVVRLWPSLFGLLGIGITGLLGRSMYNPWVGWVSAGLLAATPIYFGLSQIVILDMPLSALMTVGLAAFWFAYVREPQRRGFVLLLYVATALGVLTKGPVAAVLTGAIIFAFLGLRRELAALRWVLSPLGIAAFVLITLPWFVMVSHRNPEFLDFFIVKQHVDRFAHADEHRQALWFFVPIVLGGMLPWSGFALLAPRRLWTFLLRVVRRRMSTAALYCIVWSGVVFVFFSLSGSKLGTYILPMFYPLAVLGARFFEQLIAGRQRSVLVRGAVIILVVAVLVAVGTLVTNEVVDAWQVALIVPQLWLGAGILAVASCTALALMRSRTPSVARLQAGFATMLAGTLALQLVAISGRGVTAQYRPLGLVLRRQARPEDQIVVYIHYVQGVTFYSQRRTIMVRGRGELDFGSRQGDQAAFFWESDAQLLDAWRSGRRIFLVINRSELEPLRTQLQPAPRQLAAHGKKVIVVNFS